MRIDSCTIKKTDVLDTTRQAAVVVDVSPGYLQNARLVPSHPLKFIKIGKSVFYRREDLLEWNARRKGSSSDQTGVVT